MPLEFPAHAPNHIPATIQKLVEKYQTLAAQQPSLVLNHAIAGKPLIS